MQSGSSALLRAAGVACSRTRSYFAFQEVVLLLGKRVPACLIFGIILCPFLHVKKNGFVNVNFKQD